MTHGDNDGSNAAITMALTNYQRQKRWRDKNRATYNLKRRNRRKNLSRSDESQDQIASETDKNVGQYHGGSMPLDRGVNAPPTQPSKIEELRQLMAEASTAPTEPVVKLAVYRNYYGQVITEKQWNQLQAIKAKAKEGGYEIDEYSQ